MTRERVIEALKEGWVTRRELCDMLDMCDIDMRVYIANLNRFLLSEGQCVLSTLRKKGYHIPSANNAEDVALCEKALKELEAKAISILQRRKSIKHFLARIKEEPTLI